jgi:hypothetical protein
MGSLTYSTVKYLCARLEEHDKVQSCALMTGPGEDPILRIERTNGPPVKVYVVWAYDFTFGEYLALSGRVRPGDFILAAGFGGSSDEVNWNIIKQGREDGIGVGNLGRLFGALNFSDVSRYLTREEKGHSR